MADNANKEIKTATADDGSTGYEIGSVLAPLPC